MFIEMQESAEGIDSMIGFQVDCLFTAIIGAIVIGLVSFVVSRVIPH